VNTSRGNSIVLIEAVASIRGNMVVEQYLPLHSCIPSTGAWNNIMYISNRVVNSYKLDRSWREAVDGYASARAHSPLLHIGGGLGYQGVLFRYRGCLCWIQEKHTQTVIRTYNVGVALWGRVMQRTRSVSGRLLTALNRRRTKLKANSAWNAISAAWRLPVPAAETDLVHQRHRHWHLSQFLCTIGLLDVA